MYKPFFNSQVQNQAVGWAGFHSSKGYSLLSVIDKWEFMWDSIWDFMKIYLAQELT